MFVVVVVMILSRCTTRPDSPVPSLQGACDRSLKSEVPCGSCLNWRWGPLPRHQTQWSPERPLSKYLYFIFTWQSKPWCDPRKGNGLGGYWKVIRRNWNWTSNIIRGNGSWCDSHSWHWSISALDKDSASDSPGLTGKEGKKNSKEYLILLFVITCLLCNLLIQNWYIGFLSSAKFNWLVVAAWSNEVRRMLKPLLGSVEKKCHSWLVMSVRRCRTCVTPIIYDTVEEISLLRWTVWEDNQAQF